MVPLYLHGAILAHFTVEELHAFRDRNLDMRESVERQLQLRFPKLTLAYILKYTAKPLLQQSTRFNDLSETYNHIIRGLGWELYYFTITPVKDGICFRTMRAIRIHLRLVRDACCIFEACCQQLRCNTAEQHLLLFLSKFDGYDLIWCDFRDLTRVEVQIVEINRDICQHFAPDTPYFLSPNGRAILIHHTVIHFNGTITPVAIPPHSNVRWTQTCLCVDERIVYTLDDN